jgi:hypothetical protein
VKSLVSFDNLQASKKEVFALLHEFDVTDLRIKTSELSILTKRILKQMVSENLQNKALKRFSLSLDNIFFDEVFDHFLKLSENEQDKFLDMISVHKKRNFKNMIYQKLLLNYDHIKVKKMVYLLSDSYKPSVMKIQHEIFSHIIENPDHGYLYMKKGQMKGFFTFYRLIDPACLSPLSIKLIKSSLFQSEKLDYIASEAEMLFEFLVNNFLDDEGAKYGLHYMQVLDPKTYDPKIISFIIKCKNSIQNKYKELANSLDSLLYKVYEYALVYDRYVDILDELAMSLTDKIISEAFGEDERSVFWKQYTTSIKEPIVFVRFPVGLFMMKFKNIGIVEYIESGNATYLYGHDHYDTIKKRVLSSASNSKNMLNIHSFLNVTQLKNVTKAGTERYIHRGRWMAQFKSDMKRKYGILAGIKS